MITKINLKTISFLFVALFTSCGLQAAWYGEVKESNSPEAIVARISPVGKVDVAGEMPKKPKVSLKVPIGPKTGEKRYNESCKICHGAGLAGAPKPGDKAAWGPRLESEGGIDGLLASSIQGKGGMPPRGTCMSCEDDELKAAIEFMLKGT